MIHENVLPLNIDPFEQDLTNEYDPFEDLNDRIVTTRLGHPIMPVKSIIDYPSRLVKPSGFLVKKIPEEQKWATPIMTGQLTDLRKLRNLNTDLHLTKQDYSNHGEKFCFNKTFIYLFILIYIIFKK